MLTFRDYINAFVFAIVSTFFGLLASLAILAVIAAIARAIFSFQ